MAQNKVNQYGKDDPCYTIGMEQQAPIRMSMLISLKIVIIEHFPFFIGREISTYPKISS